MKATIFDGVTQRPFLPTDSAALSASTPYAWIDAVPSGPHDPQISALLEQMGFSDIVASYTTRAYSSGMFQVFGDTMLASTYAAADNGGGPVLIHCVWNAGCLITIRQGADAAIATALDDIRPRAADLFAKPGPVPGIILQLILDSIDRQLTDLQTKVGLLDGEIIVTTNPTQLTALQGFRNTVESLVTTLPSYAQNLQSTLVDPTSLPGVDAAGVQSLQSYAACVNDVVQRITSAAADVRAAIQDYQGQVGAAQGNRINQLTLVSIIFLPITFATGYFGMNFQWLVNSTETFTSWVLLGALLPIAAVVISTWLLRKGGFRIGRTHHARFHLRHPPRQ